MVKARSLESQLRQLARSMPSGLVPAAAIPELAESLGISQHQLRKELNTLSLLGKTVVSEDPLDKANRVVDSLRRENSELRKMAKSNLAGEALFSAICNELHTTVEALPAPSAIKKLDKKKITVEEDLVMHLSDEHADQVVLPHRVGGLESYNLNVALARAERYVDTTLEYTQKTLDNYRFNNLWILAYGDHVNGEIHGGTDHSFYRNAIRNTLAIGQMHAMMIRDLSPHFKNVHVLYVSGNHGRNTPKKNYHGAHDNWDYLVAETAALMCRELPNVTFMIPDAFQAIVNIQGWNFAVTHGDDIRSNLGIPYYGIERWSRRLQALHAAHTPLHYKVLGHFHNLSSMQDPTGRTIINGAWKATDEYLYNAFGGYNEPMQLIHGVHPQYGMTWSMNVYLKNRDLKGGEEEVPGRYKIDFASQDHYAADRAEVLSRLHA